MKMLVLLAATVSIILWSAVAAHAGSKRLTTGASGLTSHVECTWANVSETKSVTVVTTVYSSNGTVVAQSAEVTLAPGVRTQLGFVQTDLRCDFLIVSGSSKDVRANMVMYEGSGNVVATEVAREK